jgi:hypothetical protein
VVKQGDSGSETTAMHEAVKVCGFETVKLLRELGSHVNKVNHAGEAPLDLIGRYRGGIPKDLAIHQFLIGEIKTASASQEGAWVQGLKQGCARLRGDNLELTG